jgi:hypothetical protein
MKESFFFSRFFSDFDNFFTSTASKKKKKGKTNAGDSHCLPIKGLKANLF